MQKGCIFLVFKAHLLNPQMLQFHPKMLRVAVEMVQYIVVITFYDLSGTILR